MKCWKTTIFDVHFKMSVLSQTAFVSSFPAFLLRLHFFIDHPSPYSPSCPHRAVCAVAIMHTLHTMQQCWLSMGLRWGFGWLNTLKLMILRFLNGTTFLHSVRLFPIAWLASHGRETACWDDWGGFEAPEGIKANILHDFRSINIINISLYHHWQHVSFKQRITN